MAATVKWSLFLLLVTGFDVNFAQIMKTERSEIEEMMSLSCEDGIIRIVTESYLLHSCDLCSSEAGVRQCRVNYDPRERYELYQACSGKTHCEHVPTPKKEDVSQDCGTDHFQMEAEVTYDCILGEQLIQFCDENSRQLPLPHIIFDGTLKKDRTHSCRCKANTGNNGTMQMIMEDIRLRHPSNDTKCSKARLKILNEEHVCDSSVRAEEEFINSGENKMPPAFELTLDDLYDNSNDDRPSMIWISLQAGDVSEITVACSTEQLSVECPQLANINNGEIAITRTTVGDEATYSCYDSFVLSTAVTRLCREDGTWDGTEPTCIAKGENEDHDYLTSGGSETDNTLYIAVPTSIITVLIVIVAFWIWKWRRMTSTVKESSVVYRKPSHSVENCVPTITNIYESLKDHSSHVIEESDNYISFVTIRD